MSAPCHKPEPPSSSLLISLVSVSSSPSLSHQTVELADPTMTVASPRLLLSDMVSQSGSNLPSSYIRPIDDRPNLRDVVEASDASIPLIDLQGMDGGSRGKVVEAIGRACENDGFFQIKNHGIPHESVEGMLRVAREFFRLPADERLRYYSDDPNKSTRLSTSFNVRTEKVSNWRDFLRLHCYPLEDFVHEWPFNPQCFREVVGEYSKHARDLALRLLGLISESLGLARDYMEKAMGRHAQHMAINFYPPCPNPELTYGLPGHKDPNAITILLQDDVAGLQVLRNGKWVAINPMPDTLIINIGDQIQVLSNDHYKSALHRALVNSSRERVSVPTFYCPSADAPMGPPPVLVDEEHPSAYRSFTYGEYYQKFWNRGLATDSCLDMFRNSRHTIVSGSHRGLETSM